MRRLVATSLSALERLRLEVRPCLRLALLLGTAAWTGLGAEAPLTTVRQVLELSRDHAARGLPVNVQGVLVYADRSWDIWFFHDGQAGIALDFGTRLPDVPMGTALALEGRSRPGGYAPLIAVSSHRTSGLSPFPEPLRLPAADLTSGEADAQWVAVEGQVRQVYLDQGEHLVLEVVGPTRFRAYVPGVSNLAPAAGLDGATVQLTGLWASEANPNGQLIANKMFVPSTNQIHILHPAEPAPLAGKPDAIGRLLQYRRTGQPGQRILVKGIVTALRPTSFFVQDDTGALRVFRTAPAKLRVGERVLAAGFARTGGYRPALEDGVFRVEGPGELPPPRPVTVRQMREEGLDSLLVRIEGVVVDSSLRREGLLLVLRSGDDTVEATLPAEFATRDLLRHRPGAVLALVGPASFRLDELHRPQALELFLRSAGDVAVVRAAPWWTVPRLLGLGALAAMAFLSRLAFVQRREARLQARYRLLFESAHDPIFVARADGTFVSVNAACERLTGIPRSQLVDRPLSGCFTPACAPAAMATFRRALAGEPVPLLLLEVRSDSGEVKSVEVSLRALSGAGSPGLVLAIGRDVTERCKLDARVQFLTAALESAANCVIVTNTDGVIEWVNAAFTRLTGYERAEALGQKPNLLKSDEVPPETYARLWQEILAGRVWQGELINRRKDQSRYVANLSITPVRDGTGTIRHFIGIQQDVTERRQAETTWHAVVTGTAGATGAAFFPNLVEQLARAFGVRFAFMAETDGDTARVLAAWQDGALVPTFSYQLAGTPCEQVLDKPLCVFPDRLRPQFPHDPLLETLQAESYAGARLLAADGRALGVLAMVDVRPMRDTPVLRSILTLFATRAAAELERLAAEVRLRQSEARYRTTIEAIPDLLFRVNRAGVYLDFKADNAADLYVPPERILGRRIADLMPRDHTELVLPLIHRALDTGQPQTFDYSLPIRGMLRHYECRIRRLDTDEAICIARDITERRATELVRRRLEAQARQAQKLEAVGTLAGGIAHEFNNILGAIIGFSELAQLDTRDNPNAQECIGEVLQAGHRAKDLVRQILTFSRQEDQRQSVVRLQPVVKETVKLLRATLPPQVELRPDIDPDAPTVMADPTQIQQLLMNLCVNGWQAMSERGGLLQIGLRSCVLAQPQPAYDGDLLPGHYVVLEVQDDGEGMDAATTERIFEPFFTTRGPQGGPGMGLAVVHGIVQAHGAQIQLATAPGQGTTFRVFLPHCELAAPTLETPADFWVTGHGERILFVDDERPLSELAQRTLRLLNYEVEVFADPREALAAFAARPAEFHLALLDLAMPGLSGLDCARRIRSARLDLPILLATGHGGSLADDELAALGIREVLLKPYTAQALAAAVYRVLSTGEGPAPSPEPAR